MSGAQAAPAFDSIIHSPRRQCRAEVAWASCTWSCVPPPCGRTHGSYGNYANYERHGYRLSGSRGGMGIPAHGLFSGCLWGGEGQTLRFAEQGLRERRCQSLAIHPQPNPLPSRTAGRVRRRTAPGAPLQLLQRGIQRARRAGPFGTWRRNQLEMGCLRACNESAYQVYGNGTTRQGAMLCAPKRRMVTWISVPCCSKSSSSSCSCLS